MSDEPTLAYLADAISDGCGDCDYCLAAKALRESEDHWRRVKLPCFRDRKTFTVGINCGECANCKADDWRHR